MLFVAQAGQVAAITRPLAVMEQMAERHSSARTFLPLAVKAAKAGKKAVTMAVLVVTEELVEAAATATEETAATAEPTAGAAVALVATAEGTAVTVEPTEAVEDAQAEELPATVELMAETAELNQMEKMAHPLRLQLLTQLFLGT